MTDALAIYNQFDQLQRAALALSKSGYFKDVQSEAQAIVKVMAGAELGLPPFASMTGIHIIQGKPALGSNVIATLVKNDPRYDYQIVNCDNTICKLAWFENGKQVGVSSFTMEEAKIAGLTGKDNWTKFPSDMLFARAITRGARRFAPGIFGGSPVYTPEELGADEDEDGHVIEVKARDVTPPPVVPPAPEPPPAQWDAAFAEQHQAESPKTAMTLEFAEAEMDRNGIRYGDIDSEKLAFMATELETTLKKKGLTEAAIDKAQRKLEAAKTIMAHRNAK